MRYILIILVLLGPGAPRSGFSSPAVSDQQPESATTSPEHAGSLPGTSRTAAQAPADARPVRGRPPGGDWRGGSPAPATNRAWIRYFFSLLVVGSVLVGVLVVLRRLRTHLVGTPRQHNLRLLGRLSLDPRNSLTLVSVKNEQLLVGHGPDGVRLLRRYPNDPTPHDGGTTT